VAGAGSTVLCAQRGLPKFTVHALIRSHSFVASFQRMAVQLPGGAS